MNLFKKIKDVLKKWLQPPDEKIYEQIIKNFKNMIENMVDDDYVLKYSHSFAAKGSNGGRSASGQHAKVQAKDELIMLIDTIEQEIGSVKLAKNIQKNGPYLEQLAEEIIFAIYNSKYAKWGGGRTSFDYALDVIFKDLLKGDEKGYE